MIAYKFLEPGAVGPFSGFSWPTPSGSRPGIWVQDGWTVCKSGIHACQIRDLSYWIGPELWEVELERPVAKHATKVVSPRGRLLRRIDAWDDGARAEFVRWCIDRARLFVDATPRLEAWGRNLDANALGGPALSGYVAARIREEAEGREGFDLERALQGEWLGQVLGLNDS